MTQIKLRRDTSANFTSKNPVLGIGEPAYETDTKKLKIGDGTTAYTQLEYFSSGGGGSANIGAVLPLKIANGVISLEVDGQTIQIVDGKLHANLDELGNEVNTLAGDIAGVQADLLKKEDKLTASSPIIKTEEEKTNAVGFTTSGTTMTTSGSYSDGDWSNQAYGLFVLTDYMAGTKDNYVDIPYQIGDIVKVPQSSGFYNVSTGAFGFINNSGAFRPVAPLYDSGNRNQSRYDEVTIEPYKNGYYLNSTNHISWGGTSSSITTKARNNYNYCQIRDEGTSVVLITASFGSNTSLTKRIFLKTENDGVQYDKLLKSTMVRVYPAGNQREVLDTSFDTSQFGLYKGLGKLEDLAPNFETIEAATNQFDVLDTTKVNDLSLALGNGLSVVDGKLTASSTIPSNMVTTDTAQTITGSKTFKGPIKVTNSGYTRTLADVNTNGEGPYLYLGESTSRMYLQASSPINRMSSGGVEYPIIDTGNLGSYVDGTTITYKNNRLSASAVGLELCDIGMSLFVDETKGLRRYLNGQIVDINTNTQAFLNRLKEITTLHPSLLCTEEEWQTAKTMSAFGQVGKFVFNYSGDEIVSVRLPRVVNVQGLFDLQNLGMTVRQSLPNITGSFYAATRIDTTTGAFTRTTRYEGFNGSNNNSGSYNTFNASRSSSTYQDNAPVQQEAIQYPYFIQIATGSETENNIVNDIELNNPFTFGMSQYYKGEMNNISWLKSDGEYHPKATYPSFYNWVLTNVNAGKDGFKLSTDESATDYDFRINTANESFRLPLKNGSEALIGSEVVNYVVPTVDGQTYTATHNGQVQLYATTTAVNQFIRVTNVTTGEISEMRSPADGAGNVASVWVNRGDTFRVTGDVITTISSVTLFKAVGNGNLYYYVGETVQNANLINAGRIGEQLADKIGRTECKAYITETYVNGTSGYRLYSDKYIEQWGYKSGTNSEIITFLKAFKNTNYNVVMATEKPSKFFQGVYSNKTTTNMKIDYTGDSGGSALGTSWMVTGYIA